MLSLSARRAWIEITFFYIILHRIRVALRKESVDRNCRHATESRQTLWSLSARRAWIEIHDKVSIPPAQKSLSARRAWIEIAMTGQISVSTVGRSPQGERG